MTKLRAPHVALVLSIAAVTAAGCGSSSSSKSRAANTPAQSTPAPSTPSTPSTPTSTTGAQITASTPISSPVFRALLIKGEAQAAKGRLNQKELGELADCAIKKFEAEGVKTAGEASQHQAQSRQFGAECAKELNLHLH